MVPENHKPIPKSIAIFGANGRSGNSLAKWLRFHAHHVRLRLIGSDARSVAQLKRQFADADVVQANYLDRPSLDAAVAGMEGLYVVSRELTPEELSMNNLVAAVKRAGCLVHMIRLTGLQPDANPRRIPKVLQDFKLGLEIQHELARQILDEAGIPVTYLNIGASMMQNFLRVGDSIQNGRTLTWPQRLIPYIDAREIGEAGGCLLLSDNHRHLYQFYTLNNGHDLLRTDEVVNMMSEVFQTKLRLDSSRAGFDAMFKPLVEAGFVPKVLPDYLWNFFDYERENQVIWTPNQYLERILGRRPMTLRGWLQEHRHVIVPEQDRDDDSAAAASPPATSAQGPATGPASPDGSWNLEVHTPAGVEYMTLNLNCRDGQLTGQAIDNNRTMELEQGRFDGKKLAWRMTITVPFKINLQVEAALNGDVIEGMAKSGIPGVKAKIKAQRRR